MNTYQLIAFLFILGISFSCSDDDGTSQTQEAQSLQEMLKEIKDLASSKKCEDATEWTFTSYGSKACGGPVGYIAYSTTIDTALFLDKIAEHRIAQDQFNIFTKK